MKVGSTSRLEPDTSSVMPTVKLLRGDCLSSSSNAAFAMAGVKSLEESP